MVIKYKMPELMAKELLKTRKGTDKSLSNQEYLCKVVNESFGLIYPCVEVVLF